jgi:hypothetical protein
MRTPSSRNGALCSRIGSGGERPAAARPGRTGKPAERIVPLETLGDAGRTMGFDPIAARACALRGKFPMLSVSEPVGSNALDFELAQPWQLRPDHFRSTQEAAA